MEDLTHRVGLETAQLEALATAGAFDCFSLSRRQALWRAGSAARDQPGTLPGITTPGPETAGGPSPTATEDPSPTPRSQRKAPGATSKGAAGATTPEERPARDRPLGDRPVQLPLFEDPSPYEILADDIWATGVSTTDHLLAHLRPRLSQRGVLSCAGLRTAEAGRRVQVAGLVIHRQHPSTASGITFLDLEDETGIANVICSQGFWRRHRRVLLESNGLIIRGLLERSDEGVVNLLADPLPRLPVRR